MARDEGFEPPITGPEPVALPLGQSLTFVMIKKFYMTEGHIHTSCIIAPGAEMNSAARAALFPRATGRNYNAFVPVMPVFST